MRHEPRPAKERVREERERQRAERAALAEFEREKARPAKEQSHYLGALVKPEAKGDAKGVPDLKVKLTEIDEANSGALPR